MSEYRQEELLYLEESTKKGNKAFVASIMDFIVKHNILSLNDIVNLTSQDWCRNNLHSSYPILKEVDPHRDLTLQLKDNPASKENRYYGQIYTFFKLYPEEWTRNVVRRAPHPQTVDRAKSAASPV